MVTITDQMSREHAHQFVLAAVLFELLGLLLRRWQQRQPEQAPEVDRVPDGQVRGDIDPHVVLPAPSPRPWTRSSMSATTTVHR